MVVAAHLSPVECGGDSHGMSLPFCHGGEQLGASGCGEEHGGDSTLQ